MPRIRPLVAAVVLGLTISACAGPAAAQEIRSDVARAGADPVAAQDARAALHAFSADLY